MFKKANVSVIKPKYLKKTNFAYVPYKTMVRKT